MELLRKLFNTPNTIPPWENTSQYPSNHPVVFIVMPRDEYSYLGKLHLSTNIDRYTQKYCNRVSKHSIQVNIENIRPNLRMLILADYSITDKRVGFMEELRKLLESYAT